MYKLKKIFKNEKGQGMVEYGLILALVSIVAVLGLGTLGGNIKGQLEGITDSMGGISEPGKVPPEIGGPIKWARYNINNILDEDLEDIHLRESSIMFDPFHIYEGNINFDPNKEYNIKFSGGTQQEEQENTMSFTNIKANMNKELTFNQSDGNSMTIISDAGGQYNKLKTSIENLPEGVRWSQLYKYLLTFVTGEHPKSEEITEVILNSREKGNDWFEHVVNEIGPIIAEDGKTDLFENNPFLMIGAAASIDGMMTYKEFSDRNDIWAISTSELYDFSTAYGGYIDKMIIDELSPHGFVNGEEGDYPDNGQQGNYWYKIIE